MQRVGQAEAADGDVGSLGAAAVELAFDVLALAQACASWQPGQFLRHVSALQKGRADFGQHHAQFTRQEAGDRDFKLRIGEEEHVFSSQHFALPLQRHLGALAGVCGDLIDHARRDAKGCRRRMQPGGGAFDADRERRPIRCAPRPSRGRAVSARKGCASTWCVPVPTTGMSWLWRAGRKATFSMPICLSWRAKWSSTTSGSAPTSSNCFVSAEGRMGSSDARQASSPCVKVQTPVRKF